MSNATDFDVEQFAAHVARLQYEHATRSEKEAAMRSAAAIQSWGCKVPPAIDVVIRDQIVAENRTAWLRNAECVIRTLDHQAFASGSFHVIDARDLGLPSGYLGMTVAAHMHILARDYLPRTARNPVAAVAINVEAVARSTVNAAWLDNEHTSQQVQAAVGAIAAHEYSHFVVATVEGHTIPATASIEGTVNALRTKGADRPHNARTHGAAWCRAYAHLVRRASFLPFSDVWVKRFCDDVRSAAPVDPDDVLDALHTELLSLTNDDALADVIRTPAPEAFARLFHHATAAAAAGQE